MTAFSASGKPAPLATANGRWRRARGVKKGSPRLGAPLIWCWRLSARYSFDDFLPCLAARAHGQNDRGRAGDDVAARKDVGNGGFASVLVGLDVAPLVELELRRGLEQTGGV